MILNELKTQFQSAEPVTRDLMALLEATFRPYQEARVLFFQKLPSHLHSSELVSLVNVEIKNRLFDAKLCEGIQDALKALRRCIIRLEDVRAAQPELSPAVNDLARLTGLAEQVEALYQKHWEHYRYPTHLNEQGLIALLMEIDTIGAAWRDYLVAHTAVQRLEQSLSAGPPPADTVALKITYSQAAPWQFSVATLRALMDFLDSAYRFISALHGRDAEAQPLTLLQISVGEPVELHLAIPIIFGQGYHQLLHYLFLKDMLKRETLLKFVFEVLEKQILVKSGSGKALDSGTSAALQKDLALKLKALPLSARFTISDRTFPDDEIPVLRELTAALERSQIDAEALLGGPLHKSTDRAKPGPKPRAAEPRPTEPRAVQPKPALQPAPMAEPASVLDARPIATPEFKPLPDLKPARPVPTEFKPAPLVARPLSPKLSDSKLSDSKLHEPGALPLSAQPPALGAGSPAPSAPGPAAATQGQRKEYIHILTEKIP